MCEKCVSLVCCFKAIIFSIALNQLSVSLAKKDVFSVHGRWKKSVQIQKNLIYKDAFSHLISIKKFSDICNSIAKPLMEPLLTERQEVEKKLTILVRLNE